MLTYALFMLTYALFMLTYADVCRRMLTYADGNYQLEDVEAAIAKFAELGTHFTCFTGTKVQILTQKALCC